MSRISSNVTVSIVAPPATALAAAVASLSAQISGGGSRWLQLTTTNPSVFFGGSSTGNIIPYQNNGVWDPVHARAHVVGQDHNMGGLRHVTYVEQTNTWGITDSFANYGDANGHGYDSLECDPGTGDLFFMRYGGGANLAKWPYGGHWSMTYADLGSGNITYGCAMWTGALAGLTSGHNALFVHEAAFGQLWIFDVSSGTKVIDDQSPPGWTPGYSNLAAYSAVKSCAVYGGGNNHSKDMFRYNADATITALATAPAGVNIGIQQGTLCEDPGGSGNFLILSGGGLWELNPDGSGTYTQQTGTRVPPANVNTADGTSNSICVIPISTYGVMMTISVDGGSSVTIHLYKHG